MGNITDYYEGYDYSITHKKNRFIFTGRMESQEYDLENFFGQIISELEEDEIIFDFTGLLYTNTRAEVVLNYVIGRIPKNKTVYFELNSEIEWQLTTLEFFQLICPGKVQLVNPVKS